MNLKKGQRVRQNIARLSTVGSKLDRKMNDECTPTLYQKHSSISPGAKSSTKLRTKYPKTCARLSTAYSCSILTQVPCNELRLALRRWERIIRPCVFLAMALLQLPLANGQRGDVATFGMLHIAYIIMRQTTVCALQFSIRQSYRS